VLRAEDAKMDTIIPALEELSRKYIKNENNYA
jgi:hypothetical protein